MSSHGEISTECRDKVLKAIQDILDTRDKRYMFLRMEFKRLVPLINLEGTPINVSWNIYEEFRKQGMVGSLIATFNGKFDTDLMLETK